MRSDREFFDKAEMVGLIEDRLKRNLQLSNRIDRLFSDAAMTVKGKLAFNYELLERIKKIDENSITINKMIDFFMEEIYKYQNNRLVQQECFSYIGKIQIQWYFDQEHPNGFNEFGEKI